MLVSLICLKVYQHMFYQMQKLDKINLGERFYVIVMFFGNMNNDLSWNPWSSRLHFTSRYSSFEWKINRSNPIFCFGAATSLREEREETFWMQTNYSTLILSLCHTMEWFRKYMNFHTNIYVQLIGSNINNQYSCMIPNNNYTISNILILKIQTN